MTHRFDRTAIEATTGEILVEAGEAQYTVVYGRWSRLGAHTSSVTRFKHIQTSNLKEALRIDPDFESGDVWFVLEGHCKEAQE